MRNAQKTLILLTMVAAAAAAGCGADFTEPASHTLPNAVPPRQQWSVSGDLTNPAAAIDGATSTAAVTGPSYKDAQITIDLGRAAVFNMVVIDHGVNEMGFARRVAVLTSTDGVNFTFRYGAAGKRRVTILSLMTPALARYVRLQVVEPGDQPWSVAEVYLQ